MFYRLIADAVLPIHLAFVLFVVVGGFLVLRWPRLAWVHLPVVAWGAFIEFTGTICPLTPLENWLRARGGEAGYGGGFIEHYLVPLIYPGALTREIQVGLGLFVLVLNAGVYTYLLRRRRGAAH